MTRDIRKERQVSHQTFHQLSTATALDGGVSRGAVRVGMLRQHGDLGLGTFKNLDGEMVLVDGRFDHVRTSPMCPTPAGVGSVEVAAVQPEFELYNVSGTLVGFWSPDYAGTLEMPGYHLHFVSDDRESGGHLLQCRGVDLRLLVQREGEYLIALPGPDGFTTAELRRDQATDLHRAERER